MVREHIDITIPYALVAIMNNPEFMSNLTHLVVNCLL
jgi:hypothetical protein